jgi:hypothetical protein
MLKELSWYLKCKEMEKLTGTWENTGIHIYFWTQHNIRNCPLAQPQLLRSETATDITWDKLFSSIQSNPNFVWHMKGLLLIILSLSSTWQEFFDIFCPSLFATWMKSHPPSKGICNEMDELNHPSQQGCGCGWRSLPLHAHARNHPTKAINKQINDNKTALSNPARRS